jgi:flagellar basal-body rod modification protein FlgD
MDLSAIYGATSDPSGSTAPAQQQLGKQDFLDLMVQQLRNQDPLKPTSNEDFIAQLASFSSLEEMERMNENLVGMVYLQQSNALLQQLTDSSSMIGKSVTWQDPLTGEASSGLVSSVKLQDGLAVLNIDGQDVPLATVTEIVAAGSGEQETDGETDTESEA